MKIRQGFVSNSSSSSFICEVCGEVEAGMDLSLEDAEMLQCVKGHTFHESDIVGELETKEDSEDEDSDEDDSEIDSKFCPICTMTHIRDKDVLEFTLSHFETDRKAMEDLMRTKKVKIK